MPFPSLHDSVHGRTETSDCPSDSCGHEGSVSNLAMWGMKPTLSQGSLLIRYEFGEALAPLDDIQMGR